MENGHGDEIARLCDEIRALLDAPLAPGRESLEGLEHTLTEGYARALALDAEQRRLERRIAELGMDVRRGREGAAEDLAALAGRVSTASGRLARLRALLAGLRERTNAVRAAGGYAAVENARS